VKPGALGNLGNAYLDSGQIRKAIEYQQKSLEIKESIGDRRGAADSLGNLGNAYTKLGEFRRAIDSHERALAIDLEIGNRRGEGKGLGNLGMIYRAEASIIELS